MCCGTKEKRKKSVSGNQVKNGDNSCRPIKNIHCYTVKTMK